MNSDLYNRFEQRFGPENIDLTTNLPVIAPRVESILPDMIHFLSSEKECGITVTGGGTSDGLFTVDNTVTVSLSRLDRVLEVNPGDFLIVAQTGARTDDACEEGIRSGLLLPLDITSGKKSTLGGAYMTAAVSPYSAGYGPFRDYIIGAKCITGQGEMVSFGGRTAKNVTGYEITRFLAGTRGLFAVALELTLKVLPLPEVRTIVSAHFTGGENLPGLVSAVNALGSAMKRFELCAENGLGNEILTGIGIEGMEPIVSREVKTVKNILEKAGAESIHEENPEQFMEKRRAIAYRLAGEGLITFTAPPSASGSLLGVLQQKYPGMPLIAHPRIGRFHMLSYDENSVQQLRERVLAVGGKNPTVWGQIAREGLSSLLTPAERSVALTLKQELDPRGILNPGLRL
ncbi:MAG: FAD-binding oxidoreductase [Candidatus Latescibacterota bacterium]